MKTGKSRGHSYVSLDLIAAGEGVGIQVMTDGLDRLGIPDEWDVSVVIPIY